jgi:hypothetical protein
MGKSYIFQLFPIMKIYKGEMIALVSRVLSQILIQVNIALHDWQ